MVFLKLNIGKFTVMKFADKFYESEVLNNKDIDDTIYG